MNNPAETAADKVPFVGLYWYSGDKILESYRERADKAAASEISIDTAMGHSDYWDQNPCSANMAKPMMLSRAAESYI